MTSGVWQITAMMPPAAKHPVILRVVSGQDSSITRGDRLAGLERKTCNVRMRPPDFLPFAVPADFTARRGRRIFYNLQSIPSGDIQDSLEVARHTQLVNTQNRLGARSDDPLNFSGVHV